MEKGKNICSVVCTVIYTVICTVIGTFICTVMSSECYYEPNMQIKYKK